MKVAKQLEEIEKIEKTEIESVVWQETVSKNIYNITSYVLYP